LIYEDILERHNLTSFPTKIARGGFLWRVIQNDAIVLETSV